MASSLRWVCTVGHRKAASARLLARMATPSRVSWIAAVIHDLSPAACGSSQPATAPLCNSHLFNTHHYQLTMANYAVAQSISIRIAHPLSLLNLIATSSVFPVPQVLPPLSHIGDVRSLDCGHEPGAHLSALYAARSSARLAAATPSGSLAPKLRAAGNPRLRVDVTADRRLASLASAPQRHQFVTVTFLVLLGKCFKHPVLQHVSRLDPWIIAIIHEIRAPHRCGELSDSGGIPASRQRSNDYAQRIENCWTAPMSRFPASIYAACSTCANEAGM